MASKHSVEIDVSLNNEPIKKDFKELEKKAKSGTQAVVKAVDKMTTAMEKAGSSARETGDDYAESTSKMEKTSTEAAKSAENLEESVDNLNEQVEELGEQSQQTSRDQEELGNEIEDSRQEIEKSEKSFASWGDVAKTAVQGVMVVASTLFAAMGATAGAAFSFGTEYKKAANQIQASTGATAEEMEGLKEVMTGVYANNFGEDINEVAEAVANVKKYLGGTDDEIQKATESAFLFRDTFGYDIPESTRAASMIMKTFGGDAEHAYDLMAQGARKGLDFSGEMIDTIIEYSPQFKKAGLSAEQMFNIMAAGYEEGAWNLDKIGDAVKELNIRLVDGSESTKEGLKAIGLSADDVAKKMSEGGEAATETYKQVVKSLAEMDDKQEQNIVGAQLFGTMWEDLGPDVVAQLAQMEGVFDDVEGTMKEINNVKYDDAQSALEALKRKAEVSLLLPLSEDIMPAISNATNAAIGYVDQMAEAYESNGIQGMVEKAGDIFAEIATNAAEEAPRMVEVAVSFIEKTVEGFKDNQGKLVKAGGDLVKAIAGAAVKALPKELQEPVEEAVDDVVDSLTGGGIKNGLKTFGNMFGNGFKVVSNVTKTVLPPFVKIIDVTADSLDDLIPIVAAGVAAFKGYSIINNLTSSSRIASTAIKLMTGEIKASTVTTAAWNMVLNANPAALLVSGVVALTAACAAYILTVDRTDEQQEAFNKRMSELDEKLEKNRESLDSLSDSMADTFRSIETTGAPLDRLKDKLDAAFDSTGKVKEGNEALASSILTQLNDAMGTQYSLTADGFIQNNEGVKQSIDDVNASIDEYVSSLKQKALSEVVSTQYAEAIQNQANAQENLNTAQEEYNTALENYANARKNFSETHDMETVEKAGAQLEETTKKLQETSGAAAEAEAVIEGLDEIMDTLGEGTPESIKKATEAYGKLPAEAEKAKDGVVASADLIQKSLDSTDYTKMVEGFRLAAQQVKASGGEIPESLQKSLVEALNKFDELSPEAKSSAMEMMWSMIEGMEGTAPEFANVADMTSEETIQAFQEYLVNSGALKDIGIQSMDDLAAGVSSNNNPVDEAKTVGENTKTELRKINAEPEGKELTEEFATGIDKSLGKAKESAKKVATTAKKSAGSIEGFSPGIAFGGQYASGVKSKSAISGLAGSAVATASKNAMASITATQTGTAFGGQYTSGVQSKTGIARTAGTQLVTSAKSGAGSVSSYGTGQNFGQGFINGIGSMLGGVARAAANLASRALSAVRTTIDSHSPSKETEELGENFDLGFVNEIVRLTDKAADAAGNMGLEALNSLRESMQLSNIGFDIDSVMHDVEAQINAKMLLYSSEINKVAAKQEDNSSSKSTERKNRDLDMLADKIVYAFDRAGFRFKVGEREFGRLVREVR